ncbi:uncharacterized protein LOC128235991 [Mya arenaria]|uniref:uncharacterized protein LOC128235991 n=1 Tax=Mya arenaria TaxID=6604 RepID=UPI0022E1FE49|nr:uncharacterized protein LOC128235991 [Mya arenaria]
MNRELMSSSGSSVAKTCKMNELKKRSNNWTDSELHSALSTILNQHDSLFGKFKGATLGNKDKEAKWDEIVMEINSAQYEMHTMVCDARFIIMDVVAKWPGSVHDSRVFRESRLCAQLENGMDGVLLGDSGYACKKYLMTPYLNPQTQTQESCGGTRRTVEEVRKMYQNSKQRAKEKFFRSQKTGGGPGEQFSACDNLLLDKLKDTNVLTGIAGGVESGSYSFIIENDHDNSQPGTGACGRSNENITCTMKFHMYLQRKCRGNLENDQLRWTNCMSWKRREPE